MAFGEAARPEFHDYTVQVLRTRPPSARALAADGFRLVSGGTENHQVLLDLRPFDPELTGKQAEQVLDRAGITCNRNTIPDDPRPPFAGSGLRLGSAAETTAGMGESEMEIIGELIGRALRQRDDADALTPVRAEVGALLRRVPAVPDAHRSVTLRPAGRR